jgi:hypothetical protein
MAMMATIVRLIPVGLSQMAGVLIGVVPAAERRTSLPCAATTSGQRHPFVVPQPLEVRASTVERDTCSSQPSSVSSPEVVPV